MDGHAAGARMGGILSQAVADHQVRLQAVAQQHGRERVLDHDQQWMAVSNVAQRLADRLGAIQFLQQGMAFVSLIPLVEENHRGPKLHVACKQLLAHLVVLGALAAK